MRLQTYDYWFIEVDEFRPIGRGIDTYCFGKGGGGTPKMPVIQASTMAAKAPTAEMTQAESLNRRLAASMVTKDWGKLTLGKTGLLGGGNASV